MTPAPRGQRTRSRWPDVGLFLVVLLAMGSSAYALNGPAPLPGGPPVVTPSPPSAPVTSLWFGDSIVEGCCRRTGASPTMAQVAAAELAWERPEVVGAGGTGYVTARTLKGKRVGPYPERIEAAVSGAYYDVVVIAGGNNDATKDFDPEPFRMAVRAVLQQVRVSLPQAKLVVVGPYSPTGFGYTAQRKIQFEEASRAGAAFIDQVAQGWMRGREDLLDADKFHPDDEGQAHLGRRAAVALRAVLAPEMTASASARNS